MPDTAHDIELTIFERIGGRTYPCRVRDPHDWVADPGVAATGDPGTTAGLLKWPCPRCGGTCATALATLRPVTFDRPAPHWCKPTGLKRFAALWTGADTGARPVVPDLPPLADA